MHLLSADTDNTSYLRKLYGFQVLCCTSFSDYFLFQEFTLEDVFIQAEVLENDLKCALKAVNQVDPNFEIKQVRSETKYSCNLVNNLNATMYSTKVLFIYSLKIFVYRSAVGKMLHSFNLKISALI